MKTLRRLYKLNNRLVHHWVWNSLKYDHHNFWEVPCDRRIYPKSNVALKSSLVPFLSWFISSDDLDSQSEVEYGKNTVGSPKLSKKFDTTELDGNIGFLLFGSWVSRIETFSFLLLAWIVREADILNQYDSYCINLASVSSYCNGSQLKNPDISGASYTFRIQY